MMNVIHIDEKWFYLSREKKNFYLHPDENQPHREFQNKNFIGKVMFLAAVARPRWDFHKRGMWDGKVGIWPFVQIKPAQKDSANRPKGTMEMKPMLVDRNAVREMMISNLIPAIKKMTRIV